MEVLSRSQTRDFARKRAEPLKAVLDRISDGILATDLEGRILFAPALPPVPCSAWARRGSLV